MTELLATCSKEKPKRPFLIMVISLTGMNIPWEYGMVILIYLRLHFLLGFRDIKIPSNSTGNMWKILWILTEFPFMVFGSLEMPMTIGFLKATRIMWALFLMQTGILDAGILTVFHKKYLKNYSMDHINMPLIMN